MELDVNKPGASLSPESLPHLLHRRSVRKLSPAFPRQLRTDLPVEPVGSCQPRYREKRISEGVVSLNKEILVERKDKAAFSVLLGGKPGQQELAGIATR